MSLRFKLSAVMAALCLVIVGTLTAARTLVRTREIEADLTRKASVYAELLGRQLVPAVAYDDEQTAREVLESASSDSDVIQIALFAEDGSLIVGSEELPETWSEPPREVTARSTANSVVAAAPVVSHEGPRGVLYLVLSTERMHHRVRHMLIMTAALSLALLALAILAAWFLVGIVVARLARIAAVADRVANGDLSGEALDPGAVDEVGRLTVGFNVMLERVRTEQERLAQLVNARTAELSASREQLEQAQRLESVGRLAAGVAHEINTPVQFANDSVLFVRDAWNDVVGLLDEYRKAGALEQREQAIDLGYLRENVPRSAERAIEGLSRIAEIVESMKTFAQEDQVEKTSTDVRIGLESTLLIAKNEYKYVADLEILFEEVPAVLARPAELNQAWLALLTNAAQAIGDRGEERGKITVRTHHDGSRVLVSIADTGCGIPESVRPRIFEQFFSTRPVGKGKGQGLAAARAVVKKHGGDIWFETKTGEGTTFFVALPVESMEPALAAVA